MVEKTFSAEKPARVLCEPTGAGSTNVWLRANIASDVADNGPEGSPIEFWTADEVHFLYAGEMAESEAESRFDELWAEHEYDGAEIGPELIGALIALLGEDE